MLGDTAVAVNPSDPRYQKLIGTKIKLPLVGREIPVIGEESVDPKFGTGAGKVTPSHSPEDYDMGKKFGLEFIRIFDYDGKSNQNVPKIIAVFSQSSPVSWLSPIWKPPVYWKKSKITPMRLATVTAAAVPLSPSLLPSGMSKSNALAQPAIKAAKDGDVKFFPVRFKKFFVTWMENIRDWNISRQIVWVPAFPPGIVSTVTPK